jgi:hypothetical protein
MHTVIFMCLFSLVEVFYLLHSCLRMRDYMHHFNNNKNNSAFVITTATLVTMAATIIVFMPSGVTTPVAATIATTASNTTTTTAPSSSGLELSPQLIWDEHATTTGRIPINETHSIVSFIGNGTMTVPDTGETVNMTNSGSGLVSPVPGYNETVSAYGREHVFSEDDGDTTAITFYEIIRYDPTTFEGKGLVTAVFDRNATGSLAPFNGMMVIGTHDEDPNAVAATIKLWQWQSAISLPTTNITTTSMEERPSPSMNATTMTNATTTAYTNATATDEEGEEQQQEQQTTTTIPAPLLE